MQKKIWIALGASFVFAAVIAVILRFMPKPVEDSDYLIAGSAATLVALLVLFLGLVPRTGDVFLKKRRKQR